MICRVPVVIFFRVFSQHRSSSPKKSTRIVQLQLGESFSYLPHKFKPQLLGGQRPYKNNGKVHLLTSKLHTNGCSSKKMKEEPSHSNSKTRPTPTEQHTLVQKPVFGIGQQPTPRRNLFKCSICGTLSNSCCSVPQFLEV